MLPSKHVKWNELACKDGTDYPYEYIEDGRVFRLCQVFENIRSLCGDKPITILSAYRTPEWNKKVGGVPSSQHVFGMALDLRHSAMINQYFGAMILENWRALGVRGIGFYPNFIHIDIRDSYKLATWSKDAKIPKINA